MKGKYSSSYGQNKQINKIPRIANTILYNKRFFRAITIHDFRLNNRAPVAEAALKQTTLGDQVYPGLNMRRGA